jgi:hypothetical protein
VAFVRSLRVACALALALLCARAASAESLQRLTVTQLTLAADTNAPRVEVPFHLLITARVRERVSELDNLDLPILAELELLGDEHTLAAGPNGSVYHETITVVAHHSGTITIAPVTLDAIDARDGHAKRYSSNSLVLHVAGPLATAVAVQRIGANWVYVFVGLFVALVVFAALRARRPRRPLPPPPAAAPIAVPAPPPAPPDPRERARRWLAQLRAEPTRAGAMRLRAEVRRSVGASETQTLADVLRRPLAQDPATARLLRALERAGFTYESDLGAAIDAVLAQLEAMAG